MEKFGKIVLHIPHSSTNGIENSNWSNKDKINTLVDRWTDWYTDVLFAPNHNERVVPISFNMSRFIVDAERLLNDPLEKIGQGILYTDYEDYHRELSTEMKNELMDAYIGHINKISNEITNETLVIDCHSFPSDLSDVDVCIGFNDDWSKPSDETISFIKKMFESRGYSVGINCPYSNSITPKTTNNYKSLMIEINKKRYLKKDNSLNKDSLFAPRVTSILNKIYVELLK